MDFDNFSGVVKYALGGDSIYDISVVYGTNVPIHFKLYCTLFI